MIRIDRGADALPPTEVLAATSALDQVIEDGGTPEFDRSLYGRAKPALVERQHGKCAFCESKLLHVASGDVEHFRPKAAWRQAPDQPLQRPGYYWLAYAWDNLLFACEQCNRRGKKNLFPLVDPGARARGPDDDLTLEQPLFVDPGSEDPAEHISFDGAVAIARTDRGRATIDALGLNRLPLVEERHSHFKIVETLGSLITLGEERNRAKRLLDQLTGPDQKWSAMVRAAHRDV